MIYIDYVAVIVSAFLFLLIGAFWFSPLMFKKSYTESLGNTKNVMEEGWKKWLGIVVIVFLISFFIAFFQALLGVVSVKSGLFVGLCLFIGLIFPTHLLTLILSKRPCKPFFIEAGYWFFSILVISGFLGA